ncbi:MAG: D-alanyl-D-alanine carboxypeptidase family protein [Sphingomonadales bacterium]
MLRTPLIAAAFMLNFAVPTHAFDTRAAQAYLLDLSTDTVLLNKDAQSSMPPSSMSKLMTLYVAFERLSDGSLTMDQPVTASPEVWRRWRLKGSTMFLAENQEVTVEQLLLGIIVQSGNDACAWLAEAVAGSEDAFIVLMNGAAERLGMTGSNFTNVNGWPDENQYVTAQDLAMLAEALVNDFPEYYELFSKRRFEFGAAASNYNNRNPLLGRVRGADGLKTGHTDAAGYGLTGSAVRDERRLILVVNGLESDSARRSESARLLEWGFSNFKTFDLLDEGDVVATAPVWMGEASGVALAAGAPLDMTLTRKARDSVSAKIRYQSPLKAPIEAGDVVGALVVSSPDGEERQVDLVAQSSVAKVTGFSKIGAAIHHLVFGATPAQTP